MESNIYAALVFDGQKLTVPGDRMGVPREDQLQGTNLERIAELAGRICYDSLGKGRSSAEYHKHIQEVQHLSVYEHCTFTVAIRASVPLDGCAPDPNFFYALLPLFIGRPGVWCESSKKNGPKSLRVTLNFRAVLEWLSWTPHVEAIYVYLHAMGWHVQRYAHKLAPTAIPDPGLECPHAVPFTVDLVTGNPDESNWENVEEQWISLLLCGSRGMSHEQVRHGDFTAISQRSTRYVDESTSPWVEHPLISAFEMDTGTSFQCGHVIVEPDDPEAKGNHSLVSVDAIAQESYADTVEHLQTWLESRDVPRATACKQARGAARGYLGNALYTEMIFSANVAQWLRMLKQRASNPADAEIRELYCKALPHLQRSAHGAAFQHLRLEPAEDGIGQVVVGYT